MLLQKHFVILHLLVEFASVSLQSEMFKITNMATLVKIMNDRLQREIDKLWESGELSNEKLQEMQSEHLRTVYK